MDIIKIMLDNGELKEVDGIFYLYNSKYYTIYTEKELDENGYVILYLVQVGKEIKNTPEGPVDTGYMIGMEISDAEEWKNVQNSITKIVEDKKDLKQSPEIQYLPITMLSTLKIKSKKKFRLMKDIIERYFGLEIINSEAIATNPIQVVSESVNELITPNINTVSAPTSIEPQPINPLTPITAVESITSPMPVEVQMPQSTLNVNSSTDVPEEKETIIDYRSRFFEEQEKNQNLELRISELESKLEEIKKLINV